VWRLVYAAAWFLTYFSPSHICSKLAMDISQSFVLASTSSLSFQFRDLLISSLLDKETDNSNTSQRNQTLTFLTGTMGNSSGSQALIYVIPVILITSILVFTLLCIMRVRRLRAEGPPDDNSTTQPSTVAPHQRRTRLFELGLMARERRSHQSRSWSSNRSQSADVESGLAALRLIPIRTNFAAHRGILQPTNIATPRGTVPPGGLEDVSAAGGRSSPVVSVSLPPLPHTPPPPYNEALRGNGRIAASQTWL